ncbi:hypothetical protein PAPYR_7163 [Paratrimastix pyriformis]|uniref:Uncharacterized protein n=1 Tax=Paratrimastix pyriformis TaxID=342808 RepID=A0ABQ8UG17_9EUKA|nr:hypothetical protein PAPYR_7163 [Paratrimastix pyriformis]
MPACSILYFLAILLQGTGVDARLIKRDLPSCERCVTFPGRIWCGGDREDCFSGDFFGGSLGNRTCYIFQTYYRNCIFNSVELIVGVIFGTLMFGIFFAALLWMCGVACRACQQRFCGSQNIPTPTRTTYTLLPAGDDGASLGPVRAPVLRNRSRERAVSGSP